MKTFICCPPRRSFQIPSARSRQQIRDRDDTRVRLINQFAYLKRNTFTQNTATGAIPADMGFGSGSMNNVYASNNIFWGNTVTNEISFGGTTLVQLIDNDYSAIDGLPAAGSVGNQNVNPQFAGAADFHLSGTSPLLAAGTLTPPGGLPTIDIEGYPRTTKGAASLGTYEDDRIFRNSFESL